MGEKNRKKRKHAQYAEDENENDNKFGIGATLAHLRGGDSPSPKRRNADKWTDPDGWTTIGRGGKKMKRQKTASYPSLGYSDLHKLRSMVNIHHLQGLVLYCLADGNTAPSFVSVRHHLMVKKAVVLFVPGLEKGMFDGSIELVPPEEDLIDLSDQAPEADTLARKRASNPFTVLDRDSGPLIDFSSDEKAGSKDRSEPGGNFQPFVANGVQQKETNRHVDKPPANSPDNFLPELLISEKLPEPLKPLVDCFKHLWPVKAPGDERHGKVHSPLHAMLNSPITKSQEEKRQIKGPKLARESKNSENKRTPVTQLVSSKEQLQENDYVLHHAWCRNSEESVHNFGQRLVKKQTEDDGWVDTDVKNLAEGDVPDKEIEKGSITTGRKVVAMDCEMCILEGGQSALTRISLVDWDGIVLMDELVKPDKPITNYVTEYSGITAEKLKDVTTTLKEIQIRILELITPHHILIGHSLNADLDALKLTHPFTIDTAILYPHPQGPPKKPRLKDLAQKYLNREIQKGHGTLGHDSVEDAKACLDLVKLKCERGPQWGTTEATTESIFTRLMRTSKPGMAHDNGNKNGKIGAIVDHGFPDRNFGNKARYCIGCTSDAQVVTGVKRAVLGDEDGMYVPGGGVDFTWARFQELAGVRGWLHDYKNGISPKVEEATTSALGEKVTETVQHIKTIHDFLPPCTLFIVCSGTGDPREMGRLQHVQRTFKQEYTAKKWDELSVKWTDVEEQALKAAVRTAREGIGFLTIT
ncbi:hypothetical protein ACLMJK_002776 [Lecanora helva]